MSSSVCAAKRPIATISFGLDQLDLPQQVRRALRDFLGRGIAVARRPALEHVGDVDVVGRARGRSRRACCRAACRPGRRTDRRAGPPPRRAPRRSASSRPSRRRRRTRSACASCAGRMRAARTPRLSAGIQPGIRALRIFRRLRLSAQLPDGRKAHLGQDLVAPAHCERQRQHQRVLAPGVRRVVAAPHRDLAEAEARVERLRAARCSAAPRGTGCARRALRAIAGGLAQQRAAVAVALVRARRSTG